MEAMTKMSFFIRSLHRQLEKLHREQSSAYMKKFIVYRGQGLTEQDFRHLVDTKGGLLSFNNFLSTSTKQEVAMEFVERAMHKSTDIVGVLFVMTIDPGKISSSSTPFALIDEYSAIKSEKEILFSMHTVFRVGDLKQAVNSSRLWEVQLALTGKNDPQLAALMQCIKGELRGSTGWHRLGDLMLNVGHFNLAEELHNELLKNASSNDDKAFTYHRLGITKSQQGQYKEAVSFYEKCLEINRKTRPGDDPSLAETYNDIGVTYNKMGDYSKALEFYEKALKIREKSLPPYHPDKAETYDNIGALYYRLGDHSKALQFHEKALKIREKTLPPNHPVLATSYNNIGGAYNNMGNYSKALEFYDKALKIRENTLPPNHPNMAISYGSIGQMYRNMDDYSKALQFHDKAHRIFEKALPQNHPHLAVSYHNYGSVYKDLGEYSKASQFYERAVEIARLSLPANHPHLQLYKESAQDVKNKM
ncbi:unnamed protein product [Rotaria sp. Silwood1]|nr:unnamed protein product [Rotaria sp. Silwood1]CAF4628770.1 unnamed protein product [Rotaria sp. Silwood1]